MEVVYDITPSQYTSPPHQLVSKPLGNILCHTRARYCQAWAYFSRGMPGTTARSGLIGCRVSLHQVAGIGYTAL